MRLRPIFLAPQPRLVSKGGLMLDGLYIPEGTEITVNPWIMYRLTSVYGEDAKDFRPERWLESEEKAMKYSENSMAFGLGERTCLRKAIALMELHNAKVQFLRTFSFKLAENKTPPKYVNLVGIAHWENMSINITKREAV
ncbi:MAG: hypothetical protein MMC33_005181 [Icmadophila ericetorum]|nr:hypothetical protein [Icmadophila ericetorum]